MKRILALSFAGVILVTNNMDSRSVVAAGGATTHPVVQASPRLEVVFANHVIELVEKNAGDRSEMARDARRLLEESSLKQLRADLEERLGHGDELKRAKKFRSLWKEMDEEFGQSEEKKNVKSFPAIGAVAAPTAPRKVPWPLCIPKGCK